MGWRRAEFQETVWLVGLQDALPLTEVESAFDTSVESIGNRDIKIQRVSALKG